MKINKEIYYHANSNIEYKVGDILIFNKETNNKMYDEVYNREYKLNDMDANYLLINKKINKDNTLSNEEFNLVFNTVNNVAYVMRELALEEVRKNEYPEYPSRLHCLYVTKEKGDAETWSKILKRNQKECKQILTLELTGELFVGDGNLMKRLNTSYNNQIEIAEKYWLGETKEEPEYLFYGTAKVIEVENINI